MENTEPTLRLPLGFNMSGCEKAFEKYLRQQLVSYYKTYLEIGVAEGATLLAVARFEAEFCIKTRFPTWNICVGCDLINGPFFNASKFLAKAFDAGLSASVMSICQDEPDQLPANNGLQVVLSENPRSIFERIPYHFGFVLIDGCHGAPCVKADFLAIEDKVCKSGIVAFHDACVEDQGVGMQHHCGEPINVRQALYDLGLLMTPSEHGTPFRVRHGWTLLEEVHGDKSANPPGNGMIFFRKE